MLSFFTVWLNDTVAFVLCDVFFFEKTNHPIALIQNFYYKEGKFDFITKFFSFIKPKFSMNFNLKSKIFSSRTVKESNVDTSLELSSENRNLRFTNPVFKYDYKSGDYFPKLYKEAYSFLIPSVLSLTSGLRTAP
jgi:hypothetical protein